MRMTLFKQRGFWITLCLLPICAFASFVKDGMGSTTDDTVEARPKTAEKTSDGIPEEGEFVLVEDVYKFKATTLEGRVLECV